MLKLLILAAVAAVVVAHDHHDQTPIAGPHKSLWYNTLPGDGGTQVYFQHGKGSSCELTEIFRRTQFSPASLRSVVFHTTHV